MVQSERAQVGNALDLIRDTLAPYVDAAMAQALGPEWPAIVADDNARRRGGGRRFPVSKRDLVVLLQAIIHRRISPWGDLHDYPRARAYASELLSLRHLHHHGDDCVDEHVRCLDTASRLLSVLGIPVPKDLATHRAATLVLPPKEGIAAHGRREAPGSLSDGELNNLGEPGQRLGEILIRAGELAVKLTRESRQLLMELDGVDSDIEKFQGNLMRLYGETGPEALALFLEAESVEVDQDGSDTYLLAALRFWTVCELASDPLGLAVQAFAVQVRLDRERAVTKALKRHGKQLRKWEGEGRQGRPPLPKLAPEDERIAGAQRLSEFRDDQPLFWRRLVQLADLVGPGSTIASFAAAHGNLQTALAIRNSDELDDSEALPFLRDAIDRLRFSAGLEPGSSYETFLVVALRMEGEICNNYGLTEDAIRAFARADEIIDRYPLAEPDLIQQQP